MECIVLAGGLGTRLQGVIGAMPKCMALVAGQPFLQHVFQYLIEQKCTRVILSLGYKHEMVEDWIAGSEWDFEIDTVIEQEPLGTGGGINLALQKARSENVVVLNGDTMFRVNLHKMLTFHQHTKALTSLALKMMTHFERYGAVTIDEEDCICSFEEKKYYEEGLINGGIYIINKADFLQKHLPEKFSFEKEYLEHYISEGRFYGFVSDAYFIDIGVPADYTQAQIDFK